MREVLKFKVMKNLDLTVVFNYLCEKGFIYENNEKGYNMSYGEYAAIDDFFKERINEAFEGIYDFIEAWNLWKDILDTYTDDVSLFMCLDEEELDFYFDYDEEEQTYTYWGKCPKVLEVLFENFKNDSCYQEAA